MNHFYTYILCTSFVLGLSNLGGLSHAADVPLVEESFAYTPGATLSGLNGGIGWTSAWSVTGGFPATVATGNLGTYPGLAYAGNSMLYYFKSNGTLSQSFNRNFTPIIDGGQTVWMSCVFACYDVKNASGLTLSGFTSDGAGAVPANLLTFTASTTAAPATFCKLFGGATLFTGDSTMKVHLVVVKIVFSGNANAETVTAYVDPTISADPTTWTGITTLGLYANAGLNRLSFTGGKASTGSTNNRLLMDEFRLGTSLVAVGIIKDPILGGGNDTTAPSAPSGVTAAATSSSSITVSWTAATDNVGGSGVTGYDVFSDTTHLGATPTTTATSYNVTGLQPNTAYNFTVKAIDDAGNISSASQNASATTQAASSNGVTGSGTAGILTKWTGTTTVGNSSITETTSGFIGIGTATPGRKLDVHLGNVNNMSGVRIISSGHESCLELQNTTADGRQWQLISTGTGSGIGAGKFGIYDPAAPNVSRFLITKDGQIGIGINDPLAKLHIRSANNQLATIEKDQSTDGHGAIINFVASGVTRGRVGFAHTGSGSATLIANEIPDAMILQSTKAIQLSAGSSDSMTITEAGNVGIGPGSSAPSTRLHVVNSPATGAAFHARATMRLDDGGPESFFHFAGTPGTVLRQGLLFGTDDADIGGLIYEHSTQSMIFRVNNQENVVVSSSGRMGIGTKTPTQELDVRGTIAAIHGRFSGIVYADEVRVEAVPYPDYVFSDSYRLPSLEEVEAAIKRDKHLPGIPAAAEIEAQGLGVSHMMVKHMEKIEELTLYAIEMKKQNDALRVEMARMKEQQAAFEERVLSLLNKDDSH